MSYEKQNFVDGQILTAEHLNHMEQGIADAGPVKTVNNTAPDETGNVLIEIPEGFSGSWNDLTDKPFGEEVGYSIGLPEGWNKVSNYPDTAGLQGKALWWEHFALGEFTYVHVNDQVLTPSELIGAVATNDNEITEVVSAEGIEEHGGYFFAGSYTDGMALPLIMVVREPMSLQSDGFTPAVSPDEYDVPEEVISPPGIYFCLMQYAGGVKSLVKEDIITPIDEKYLPEALQFGRITNTIEWDGNTEGKTTVNAGEGFVLCKVSDEVISSDNYCLVRLHDDEGDTEQMGLVEVVSAAGSCMVLVNSASSAFLVAQDNDELLGLVIPEKGVYFISSPGGYTSACTFYSTRCVDSKYLDIFVAHTDADGNITTTFDEVYKALVMQKAIFLERDGDLFMFAGFYGGATDEEGFYAFYKFSAVLETPSTGDFVFNKTQIEGLALTKKNETKRIANKEI